MIYFLKGIVHSVLKDSIVLNVNNVGYRLYVSHTSNYQQNDTILIYTYNVLKQDANYLIGFTSKEEKNIFLSLIKVNGLGPKTAINILSGTDPKTLCAAINSGNIAYLKNLPGISTRAAQQILIDLKGNSNNETSQLNYEEARLALKQLKFKVSDIDAALASINEPNLTTEELIKLALVKLRQ
ncbi:MAG: Holliday junction branch migration protein RuvA [Bacilli bacterium]|nr:Holliday junction branch migration protein RuvA [Bacilli bacterium]